MVFTSSQAETWRPSEEALLWGSRKVTEAAAFHQDGGRCTAPRPEHHVKMSAGFLLSHCSPTAWGTCSPRWGGTAHMLTACSMAGWASEETIHPGPSAHSDHQGQRMRPEGPRGGCCTHSRHIPPGPGGTHGSPQVRASHKQGHLQQLLLSEHRWRHSKSTALFLAGQPGLQLPVPAEMRHSPLLPALEQVLLLRRTSSNPGCQHRGALWEGQTSAAQLWTSFI